MHSSKVNTPDLGLQKARVAALLPSVPELYTTMLGCWLDGFERPPVRTRCGEFPAERRRREGHRHVTPAP